MPLARTGSLRFLGGQAGGPQALSNRASAGTHIWVRRSPPSLYLEKRFQKDRSFLLMAPPPPPPHQT